MAGIQEVLTIGFIIIFIFFIPRLFKTDNVQAHKKIASQSQISGKKRLGIVISLFLPLTMVFILKPWEENLLLFLFVGIFPVALGWAGVWVKDGFKNNKK
ncbi:MAG: hypothetical protein HQK69_11190 [Desulfamplus sp.]|nr:hypothetical protein [Desulfamplus sp.]